MVVEMPVRGNVIVGKCPVGKCLSGKCPVGELSVRGNVRRGCVGELSGRETVLQVFQGTVFLTVIIRNAIAYIAFSLSNFEF